MPHLQGLPVTPLPFIWGKAVELCGLVMFTKQAAIATVDITTFRRQHQLADSSRGNR